MKTSQEFIALLREHQSELQQQFGIVSMRLFGSVARGDHREDESWGQVFDSIITFLAYRRLSREVH